MNDKKQAIAVSGRQGMIIMAASRPGAVICYESSRRYKPDEQPSAIYDAEGTLILGNVDGRTIISMFKRGMLHEIPSPNTKQRRFKVAPEVQSGLVKVVERAGKPEIERLTLSGLKNAAKKCGVTLDWNTNTKIMTISRPGSKLRLPITHDTEGRQILKVRHFKTLAEWEVFLKLEIQKLDAALKKAV